MSLAHRQGEWARLLVASLADAGIRDAVVSPGSRSTPFVVAAVRHPRLRCHDIIDERAAAYFALGQARLSGRPSLVICTSGTAAANYLPAVAEAGAGHTPLVVLTADRPVELAACGANQTLDQLKLYGGHARAFFDLGAPEAGERALRALRRTAAQAVWTSLYPTPGAVHLNARAGKPLEPEAARPEEASLTAAVDSLLARPIPRPSIPRRLPRDADLDELARLCRHCERGLIVCGPAPVDQGAERERIAELGRRSGFPVLAEAASQVRFGVAREAAGAVFVDAFDTLLHGDGFRAARPPELILQLGRTPTSGVWGRYPSEHPGAAHWVIAPWGWNDAQSTAARLLFADLGETLDGLLERLEPPTSESGWTAGFRAAEMAAWREAEAVLGEADELSEGAVARAVVAALPEAAVLVLGNSLPIRQVDTWCRGGSRRLAVASQRGASGIDGVVAGAAGAAGVGRRPTVLLVGDVSFLHDATGLAAARHAAAPLVIVVVNNRGGRIFEQLPLAAHPAGQGEVLEHWTTPHDCDLSHAAALHGLPFTRAGSAAELRAALAEGLGRQGCSVVEAAVPAHGAAQQNRRLWRRVAAAVEAL